MASVSACSDGCHTAGEDASAEAPSSTASRASQNADNMHSQSDICESNSNSRQSEAAASDVAEGTAHNTDFQRVSVNDLPDEILIRIFSYMSFSDLLKVVQKVCPRWKRLSQDLELCADKEYVITKWSSSLGTRQRGKTDEEAIQTFRDAPNLGKVKMQRSATSHVFRALTRCHRLSELRMDDEQKLSYTVLRNLVEKCSRIHTLEMPSSLLSSKKFSEAVSQLQHLRVLRLFEPIVGRVTVLRPLGDGCPRLAQVYFARMNVELNDLSYFLNAKRNTLKSIHIGDRIYGEKCVLPLLTVCADSLEHLEIYGYELFHEEAREAFSALGCLKNLRELKVEDIGPAPPGTAALAFKGDGLPKLRLLYLGYNAGVDDEAVISISHGCPALQELFVQGAQQLSDAAFSQIHRLEHLEILDLSDSYYCDSLSGAVIPCLARLPRLHTLCLGRVEYPKLQPGLSSILEMSSLRHLKLDHCDVTGVPFDKFPGNLVSLRELSIEECVGDPKATEGLAEQMPDLKIHGSIVAELPSDDDWVTDEEVYAGPDGARGINLESDKDDFIIWNEGSISNLFLENAGPGRPDEA